MRTEKEILDSLKVLKEVCTENRGCCSNCILRNGEDYCAVLNDSGGDTYENLQEWDLKREDKPRLILNQQQ